ncbi:hypothetical protein N7468_008056 [Penicillium chermesinum]|uniref:DUF803 domain membrane protein n=1 Tax=Penicillium chermesinum TaxID=63820 RepID=A0A9W9NP23_9EURO|nr:uncharacterized protein N7468_008056 [Penicillium chermesinum]KAJ5223514.1 hypothetical protein N7468_008056 [Penicillium chermesinum]
MDSFQRPVMADLVSSFVATTITPSATRSSVYGSTALGTLTSTSVPHNGSGNSHEKLQKWSSLIGIITALVGNVLISLALNMQRYAHIRIAREYELDKLSKDPDSPEGQLRTNSYGTPNADHARKNGRGRTPTHDRRRERRNFAPYRDEAEDEDFFEVRNGRSRRNTRRNSFSSDRTARPGGEEGQGNKKSYLKSPYWWVGIILMTLGETGNFLAYGFAPASIVSPLGVVALISNCIIAPCLLKEKFRSRDFWGVLVAIAGAVVVVLSAKSSEEKIGPGEIWDMITTWEFELYLGLTCALIVGLMWASYQYGRRSLLIDVGLVALFGGYTALSTKGVSSLLTFTFWHVITYPVFYLLVFILVSSALMQIRYINRALQRFDSTQVIPTQFVLFTLSVIIGSAILYRDFESMDIARAAKFIGGCLLTFLGVYFITSGRVRGDDESTFSTDEEDAFGLLDGERYRDSVDMSPPAPVLRTSNAVLAPEASQDMPQSPSGSLASRGIDGVNEDELTPRGALSPVSSSPTVSLVGDSALSGRSLEHPSPLRPPSQMSNPWADSQDEISPSKSDLEISRPAIPPAEDESSGMESTVLLQFPPAPGIDDSAAGIRRASTPTANDEPQLSDRARASLETPRRSTRHTPLNRYSPGPFLPTLSGGISAVVVESLRRGEHSPLKDRSRRKGSRRKQLDGAFGDNPVRYQDGDLEPDDGHQSSLTVANERLQSATDNSVAAEEAGRSTPALATELYTTQTKKSDEEGTRLRSFSDSWNGGLAWLGGALRRNSVPRNAQNTVTEDTIQRGHLNTQVDSESHNHQ